MVNYFQYYSFYNILKIYEGNLTLNHIDAYRLEGLDQDLGFEEQIDGEGLTVIEWPQYIYSIIGNEYLEITININEDNSRTLVLYLMVNNMKLYWRKYHVSIMYGYQS